MKIKITCFFFLLSLSLFAQEKGASPINHQSSIINHQSQTYAVVVGVSDYQNDDIPDLRFADKDAEAFAQYLQSPAGGSLSDERLKVLTNESATTAQIAAALEWLVEVGQEGDQVIIYFSGHGDVETKSMFNLGYLLTWDSPSRTYVAGAFPLQYLQAMVTTLSVQNKAQVTLITDACRAGKLAGNTVGGAQITNANLSKQFANEVKILSCQPDEFSIEGEQWGGGRGVFSYHLVDGLYGLADNNNDGKVNLFEIGRYLEDKVSTQADPHSQFPMTAGSRTALLATVDADALARLKDQRSKETPLLAVIDSKGFEEEILIDIDSIWQQKYQQFDAAINEGRLLDAPNGESSAYDLYLELQQAIELKKLHGTMQRNLAAALQDDAQQAINAYLDSNPNELAKRYETESDYQRYPRYLRKAAEILGEQNFYYPYVMAKLYYFEGLQMRLDADKKVENASYEKAIELQTKALEFQQHAPFVLNELGVLHTRFKLSDKAFEYYQRAIDLAPEWGLPYMNYCIEAYFSGEKEKAIEYGEKAIRHNSDFPQLYNLLAWIYADRNEFGSRELWNRTGVELSDNFNFYFNNILTSEEKKKHYKRPIELLEKAVEIDTTYAHSHLNLGFCYIETGQYEEAVMLLEKAIELDSSNHFAYARLGFAHRSAKNYEAAEKPYLKAIELTKDNIYIVSDWRTHLGNLYRDMGKYDQALEQYHKAIDHGSHFASQNAARVYSRKGDYEKAEYYALQPINRFTSNAVFPRYLGTVYLSMNRSEDAEFFYAKALEINPNYRQAVLNLIWFYQKTGNQPKAQGLREKYSVSKSEEAEINSGLDNYFSQLKGAPSTALYFPKNCMMLGEYYETEGELDRANYLFKKAIEKIPDSLTNEEAIHLSEIYLKLNNWKKAQEICPQNISSDDADKNFDYGEIYYKLNRFEKAEAHFQKFLDLSKNPYKAVQVGFHYYINGDIASTEKYLGMALEMKSIQAPYIGLSLLYFAYGDYEKAIRYIDEGIQKFPNEFSLKSTRAFITAYTDTPANGMAAFAALESLQPGSTKIGTCLQLMADGDYEAAVKARKEIIENFNIQSIPLINVGYVRMLIAQKNFSAAMEVIEGNTFSVFNYGLLTNDPALAPLRETEAFKVYMQRNFQGKEME